MLIGLVGNDRATKTAVSMYLAMTADFRVVSIEEPIRNGLKAMLGLTDRDFLADRRHIPIEWLEQSPYQLIQSLGTDWGRHTVCRRMWVVLMAVRMKPMLQNGQDVLIRDVQFVDDAELVHRMGGQIWRVISPDTTPTVDVFHTSEQEQARLVEDVTLINNGTQEQLFEAIDDALCAWISRGGDLEVSHQVAA